MKVGQVALEIFNLLSPVADTLRAIRPGLQSRNHKGEKGASFKEQEGVYINSCRESHFVAIHNIVSMAAYLAISIRIHRTPIIVVLRTPGISFEKALEMNVVNYDEYKEAKNRLKSVYCKEREISAIDDDIKEGKRIAEKWFNYVFKSLMGDTWKKDKEYLLWAFNCYAPRAAMPSGEEAWKRLLEDCLENSNSLDIFPKSRGEGSATHGMDTLDGFEESAQDQFLRPPKTQKKIEGRKP